MILVSVCFCVCHNARELPLTCMAISNSQLLRLSDHMDSHKSHSKYHSNYIYKFTVSSSFRLLSVRRWQTLDCEGNMGAREFLSITVVFLAITCLMLHVQLGADAGKPRKKVRT
jgi:hypothetical protein